MSGESHELLMEVTNMIMDWEKNFRMIPEGADVIINKLNSFLLHNTSVKPVKNIRTFVNCLKEESISRLGFNINEELNAIHIIDENGHVNGELKQWYESATHQDDVDQDLVKEFLFDCRKEFKQIQDQRIIDMYSEVRAFINPSNYCITADKIMKLISNYSNVSESILKIKDWYENISLESSKAVICPVCGKILSNDIFSENRCTDMCMYYRDKLSLELKEMTVKDQLKYKKIKRGIYTYTLIPGVSELRMYDKLISELGEENVHLYPEIDKFDISIEYDSGQIFIDVKDFSSPYDLVDTLVKNKSFIKMHGVESCDYVFLVIPEHRKYIYKAGDYKGIVKRQLRKLTSKVIVIYENELYKKVGEIINEL